MVQKTIQDYYNQICNEYPTIPKSDIKRILLYGIKSLQLHNSYGGDTLINWKGFWFYCGQLMNSSLKYFEYYKRKMRVKLRVMYKRKQIQWNGYYYFALSENQYNKYLSQKNKRGRPRKKFSFNHVVLYKIYDECNIAESNKIAIFKVPISIEGGFSLYKEELVTDKAELVLLRNHLNFNDILLSNYNYQFISDNLRKYNKNNQSNGEYSTVS